MESLSTGMHHSYDCPCVGDSVEQSNCCDCLPTWTYGLTRRCRYSSMPIDMDLCESDSEYKRQVIPWFVNLAMRVLADFKIDVVHEWTWFRLIERCLSLSMKKHRRRGGKLLPTHGHSTGYQTCWMRLLRMTWLYYFWLEIVLLKVLLFGEETKTFRGMCYCHHIRMATINRY